MHFHNPLQGILNVIHGNLPWHNVIPPRPVPTQGTQSIQQAPVGVGTPNSLQRQNRYVNQMPNPVNLQGHPVNLQANSLHIQRDPNGEVIGYPINLMRSVFSQVNPAGFNTMTIPVNPTHLSWQQLYSPLPHLTAPPLLQMQHQMQPITQRYPNPNSFIGAP